VEVVAVQRSEEGFDVSLGDGSRVRSLTVLLATGVRDQPPDIPGLDACYGITVHHCPYCDGWEHRDKTVAVIGEQTSPAGLALSLRVWTEHVIACTAGRARVGTHQRRKLQAVGIPLHTGAIARIRHDAGAVKAIEFANGQSVGCDAIFFTAPQQQQCDLALRLGCEFTRRGTVKTDHLGKTCVEGIYVVGDASRDVQFAIVAAAEGAKAGVAINQALQARTGLAVERVS
jgi:thioredoxin reductase